MKKLWKDMYKAQKKEFYTEGGIKNVRPTKKQMEQAEDITSFTNWKPKFLKFLKNKNMDWLPNFVGIKIENAKDVATLINLSLIHI